jgi:outer membrane receptor protein involved in Fe transport
VYFTNHNGVINFSDNASNPFDTTYAAANAAIGVFNSYTQANAYSNGQYRYWNIEWFAQDNWKVNDRLTLDYGLRFYWVQPQHDEAGLTSNFITAGRRVNQGSGSPPPEQRLRPGIR